MKANFTDILIFSLSLLILIFSIILWIGRSKIDASKKSDKKINRRDWKNKSEY